MSNKQKNSAPKPAADPVVEPVVDPVEAQAPEIVDAAVGSVTDEAVVTEAPPVEELEPSPVAAPAEMVKGRVLRACVYGQCDDVVEIPQSQVASLHGIIDTHPDAVAYAESLK